MTTTPPPLFHLSLSPVERSKGGSATRKAAYATGRRLRDERLGETHDFRRKEHVEAVQLTLPTITGPSVPRGREEFWSHLEKAHSRGDAVPARTLDAAIPKELFDDHEAERRLATEFQEWLSETFAIAVDGGIHRMEGNHHIDFVISAKRLGPKGFGSKADELDPIAQQRGRGRGTPAVEAIRAEWALRCNKELAQRGSATRLDHRSYQRQGLDIVPGMHLGPTAASMINRNIPTHRGDAYLERQSIRDQSLKEAAKKIKLSSLLWPGPHLAARREIATLAPVVALAFPKATLTELVPTGEVIKYASLGPNNYLVGSVAPYPLPIGSGSFEEALTNMAKRRDSAQERCERFGGNWRHFGSIEDDFRRFYRMPSKGFTSIDKLIQEAWEMKLHDARSLGARAVRIIDEMWAKLQVNLKDAATDVCMEEYQLKYLEKWFALPLERRIAIERSYAIWRSKLNNKPVQSGIARPWEAPYGTLPSNAYTPSIGRSR